MATAIRNAYEPLFASNENDNLVSIIDIAAHTVVDTVPVGVEPEGMGVSPDGKFVVNTSETTNMAHVIDLDSHKIVANIVALGAMVALTGQVTRENAEKAVLSSVPEAFLELNKKAFSMGYEKALAASA